MSLNNETNGTSLPEETRAEKNPNNILVRIARWIWRLFSSVKLALILILIITALSLIGVFLIQVPADMVKNPQAYQSWVENVATDKVGPWAPLLSLLQLFNVFGSFWFFGAGTLLMINILVCSLNRWGNIRLSLRGGTVKQQVSFFSNGNEQLRAELASAPTSSSEIARLSEKILLKRGYRVRTENEGNNIYLAADKNRYFRLATYISHLSIILFVLAFIFGNVIGWRNDNFRVSEGSSPQTVGHDTNLSLQLDDFAAEYYDNGTPKDYRSQVTLYENGQAVKQALIQVNHPLVYKGVRFYQSTFGSTVKMRVSKTDSPSSTTEQSTTTPAPGTSELIYDGNVYMSPMGSSMGSGYYIGYFELPEQGYVVYIISSEVSDDSMIPADNIGIEVVKTDGTTAGVDLVPLNNPTVIGSLEFTYSGLLEYSGFQVSSDPTNVLIWIASGLFLLGISLVLYFPHRQVWILSQPNDQHSSRLLVRTIAPRGFNNKIEIESLIKDLKRQLPDQNRE
jgi:cytochrome c biogenesis protein